MSPLARGRATWSCTAATAASARSTPCSSGLAMKLIAMHGSEEHKQRWPRSTARLEAIGAFGSDRARARLGSCRPQDERREQGGDQGARRRQALDRQRLDRRRHGRVGALEARTTRSRGSLLRRARPVSRPRRWRGKGVVARDLAGRHRPRRRARPPTAPASPGAERYRDAGRVLVTTWITCAWAALGHAVAAYDAALTYARQRTVGKPLVCVPDRPGPARPDAGRRDRHAALLHADRAAGRPGRLTDTIAGLAKLNNTRKAREVSPRRATCSAATGSCSRTT